uniref:Uncharacterized protein n=1 Tax=Setaria viridis TaxID=4556 RepID=A0A4U6TTU7_SETVI|nr:hypothetical protein SEVIR_7G182700v2 [Setaria viridis]
MHPAPPHRQQSALSRGSGSDTVGRARPFFRHQTAGGRPTRRSGDVFWLGDQHRRISGPLPDSTSRIQAMSASPYCPLPDLVPDCLQWQFRRRDARKQWRWAMGRGGGEPAGRGGFREARARQERGSVRCRDGCTRERDVAFTGDVCSKNGDSACFDCFNQNGDSACYL